MNSLGWFIMTMFLIGTSCCSVSMFKNDQAIRSKQCFEQTKDLKCWGIR